jgi:pimeloyl-ACP methyl ester carboxylesterase
VDKTFKTLLCLLGVILALPLLGLIMLAIALPVTPSGIGYLLASSLLVAGLILSPWAPKLQPRLILGGLLALCLIAAARIFTGQANPASRLRMLTLPQATGSGWIAYLLDEQDGLIFGEALFHQIGGSSAREHADISQALYRDYADLRQNQAVAPSPFASTYLNLQKPGAFDAVIIEPEVNRHPDTGVIFLHGYMGNVTAQCWEVAGGVSRFGALTVCPSTGWQGQWWQPDGQAILRATFEYLRSRGIQKIILGGFSNGGFGIGRLAPTLQNEAGLRGLIFIDGITNPEAVKALGLPVLIIQGALDERMPQPEARRIAQAIGVSATYAEVQSDHFLIMKEPQAVQDALANWLESLTLLP